MTEDFQTSAGEMVRRADLERAAGTACRFGGDPSVAGYGGINLARAALAGDQAALDKFHDLVGLALPGITEHADGYIVRLVISSIDSAIAKPGELRAGFQATNQGGHDTTCIDAAQLVAWILSPDGRSALARRGVDVLTGAEPIVRAADAFVRAHCELEALAVRIGIEAASASATNDRVLALHLALERAVLGDEAVLGRRSL